MKVPVLWYSDVQGISRRGYWDQGLLEATLARETWTPVGALEFEDCKTLGAVPRGLGGAVIIVPARHHAGSGPIRNLNERLAEFEWVVLILTGDEERIFDLSLLEHPRMIVYVQTPDPDKDPADGSIRYLGDGWPPGTRETLARAAATLLDKPRGWFLSGQNTHPVRAQAFEALGDRLARKGDGARLVATAGFTQGLPRDEYLIEMSAARITPAPSGPATPDTFRLFEALEAGCVPIADECTKIGYWRLLFGEQPPFPVLDDWADVDAVLDREFAAWPANANRAWAWWQAQKRSLAYRIDDDIRAVSRQASVGPKPLRDLVTVLVTSSPAPIHPDTSHLEAIVASIRERLPDSEILIGLDGVRPELEHRRADYEEYQRRVMRLCNFAWHNVLPVRLEEHGHQANVTRRLLEAVRTPCVLFMEHDTPLVEEMPEAVWRGLSEAVLSGQANVIRLHHQTRIHPLHEHMLLDEGPRDVDGLRMLRTWQWSQRPHLASTDFYRAMIAKYFGHSSRTMIEDAMFGIVSAYVRQLGELGWRRFKLWIYAPEGNMQRSEHLDSRGDDPTFPCEFAYDGERVPRFAPKPRMSRREPIRQ